MSRLSPLEQFAIGPQLLDGIVKDAINKLATCRGAEVLSQLNILVEGNRRRNLIKGAQLGKSRTHNNAVHQHNTILEHR